MTKIFTIILQETHKMWKVRCKDRHRSDAGRRSLAEISELTRELEQLYALEDKVLACDKHAFKIPLVIHRELEPWKL